MDFHKKITKTWELLDLRVLQEASVEYQIAKKGYATARKSNKPKEWDEAKKAYEKVLNLIDIDTATHVEYAEICRKFGDFDKAIEHFNRAIGRKDERPELFKTDQSFIKSQKKLSIIIVNKKVIFNNSIGDITAVDANSGNLIWQVPTQSSSIYEDSFFLKTSDLIANNNSVLFSNNTNEFFSLNITNGVIRWKQKINSHLRYTLIENTIISITNEGYLVLTDNRTGNIIRINYVFSKLKPKKIIKALSKAEIIKIKPVGFIVGSKNVYLTTDNGKLLVIDVKEGKVISILKIDNEKISRPFVLNQSLFIIKNNSIIKLD